MKTIISEPHQGNSKGPAMQEQHEHNSAVITRAMCLLGYLSETDLSQSYRFISPTKIQNLRKQ